MVEEKKAEAEKMNLKVAQEPPVDLVHQVQVVPYNRHRHNFKIYIRHKKDKTLLVITALNFPSVSSNAGSDK